MQKCPENWASSPGSIPRSMQRPQQRINQSRVFGLIEGKRDMVGDIRAHENKDAVCILLPSIGHFIVFFLCHLVIHVENVP
jgi:hypothetical protein